MGDGRRSEAWDLYWATVEGQLGAGPSGFVRWAVPWLGPPAESDIVEVGSGAGRDLRFLLESGFRVRGVDFSPEAVRIARQLLDTLPEGIRTRGSIELDDAIRYLSNLPAGSLSAVLGLVLYATFEEDELVRLFSAVHRSLRSGGLHLWCVRADSHPLREKSAMVPPNQGGPPGHAIPHTFFSEAQCDTLTGAGFERVRLERRPETHYLFIADRKPGAPAGPAQ